MISKAQISFIKSIHQKKYRQEYQLFLAEGDKLVAEIIDSAFTIDQIYCTENKVHWLSSLLSKVSKNIEIGLVSEAEMDRISMLKSASDVLAIVKMPKNKPENLDMIDFDNQMTLVLDDIKDPGTLGTIIRIADWFGFKNMICSENCVELYNPKVVQATMGSIARVAVSIQHLPDLFANHTHLPVYGALLKGENIYQQQWQKGGFILMGSESQGISTNLIPFISNPITIPAFGGAESLNVAIATAVICSEYRRNTFLS
jgi:TrmH family RNA methyltransferase